MEVVNNSIDSVRRFGSAVMTSGVPRVGRGGGRGVEMRLVLRLVNEGN